MYVSNDVSLVDDSSGVYVCGWVGGWVIGWVCISACGGTGGKKSMFSGRIYFGFLNCSHSVFKVLN